MPFDVEVKLRVWAHTEKQQAASPESDSAVSGIVHWD